ncbi:MAG: site-specific integrase, partial [Sulfurimonas sp.]|nr:site-specific integrase [Sulfurimonas sp.]
MALKPAGGKYEGIWVNELKNGDISYYSTFAPNLPKKQSKSIAL